MYITYKLYILSYFMKLCECTKKSILFECIEINLSYNLFFRST